MGAFQLHSEWNKHQRQAAFLCLISMALQALMVSRINAVPKNYILRFLNNLQAHLSSKLIKSHPITEVEPHPKEHSLTEATYWPHPSSDGVLLSDTQRSVLSCLRGIQKHDDCIEVWTFQHTSVLWTLKADAGHLHHGAQLSSAQERPVVVISLSLSLSGRKQRGLLMQRLAWAFDVKHNHSSLCASHT